MCDVADVNSNVHNKSRVKGKESKLLYEELKLTVKIAYEILFITITQ